MLILKERSNRQADFQKLFIEKKRILTRMKYPDNRYMRIKKKK